MDIKKVFKQIFKILEWIIFLTLIFILFLVASPLLPTKTYISTHVVSTGSMEPEIITGSVVFSTLKSEEVNKGDIVVFKSPDNQEITVIHRVKDINGDEYTTKGDNNENEDSWTLFKSNILGTVIFTIPYLGYAIDFMKTPLGFGLVLGIPALILIISFIKRIKEGINEEVEKRTEEEIFKHKIQKEPPVLLLILLISTFLFLGTPSSTYALFSARVTITGMTVSTGEIEERMGEVIINEVMWSGTSLSIDDQYIELRNTTDNDINIGKWKIYYLRDLNKPPIMIPANRVIPKNGYFLISNYSNESNNSLLNIESNMSNASMNLLKENNGNLRLEDSNGNVIDTVLGVWPAGIQSTTSFRSMQRSVDGIDGLDPNSWYTCNNELCNSSKYWKTDYLSNYGSPNDMNITD